MTESRGWSSRESLLLADGWLCESRRALAVVSGVGPTDVPAALGAMATAAELAIPWSGLPGHSAEALKAIFVAASAIGAGRERDAAALVLQAYRLLQEHLSDEVKPEGAECSKDMRRTCTPGKARRSSAASQPSTPQSNGGQP